MKRFCVVFFIRPECALQFWLFISSFFFRLRIWFLNAMPPQNNFNVSVTSFLNSFIKYYILCLFAKSRVSINLLIWTN